MGHTDLYLTAADFWRSVFEPCESIYTERERPDRSLQAYPRTIPTYVLSQSPILSTLSACHETDIRGSPQVHGEVPCC